MVISDTSRIKLKIQAGKVLEEHCHMHAGARITKLRVLVQMIGFISTLVIHTLKYTYYTFNTDHTALSLIYTHSNSPLHMH
jgi:hypothetical protein